MVASHGLAQTTHAVRYMTQLCKHWSHRFPVRFDETSGEVPLPLGLCRLTTSPDRLDLVLEAADADQLGRMEQVVEEHLKRFAFREPFEIAWRREGSGT